MPKSKKIDKVYETTTTFNVEVTIIKKGEMDAVIPSEKDIKAIEAQLKSLLEADDLHVSNYKVFLGQ